MPEFGTRQVEYHRDTAGTLFAVELIEAAAWRNEFLEPPSVAAADARIVRLRGATAPKQRPAWLLVETSASGVEDLEAGYAVDGGPAAGARERQLWQASPYWRPQRATLREYLDAGLAALVSPESVEDGLLASETSALAQLGRFAADRSGREPWQTLAAAKDSSAVERWLQLSFADPNALADHVLLERLEADGESEAVELLRYLRDARIAEGNPEYVDLAVDRGALLEQATPWRHYERDDLSAAWPAVRAWIGRYRIAYDRWYRAALEDIAGTRVALADAQPQQEMLSRLDSIAALGAPDGDAAAAQLSRVITAIDALPSAAELSQPTTAGLALGEPFELATEAETALEGIGRAADQRQRRLAGSLATLVMGRADVEPLDRVLQALLASDLDDLDRVLDGPMLAQIEELLGGISPGPLTQLLAQYDEVLAETLDDVVVAFRIILEEALEGGGAVKMR